MVCSQPRRSCHELKPRSIVTPPENAAAVLEVEDEKAMSVDRERTEILEEERRRLAQDIRWLWYEFTPYEVGCDEIGGESSERNHHAEQSI